MLAGTLPNGEPQIEDAGLPVTEISLLIDDEDPLTSVADALDILVDEVREALNISTDRRFANES